MTKIYRAVVRGQFDALDESSRSELKAVAAEHDYFHSAFTANGTFTYDEQLVAFNLRYEIRFGPDVDDNSDEAAERLARDQAIRFLEGAGYAYKRLTVVVTDMATMWQ